ncbi:MAG: D-tyrosyl-tRNA(Tyr) deacylase [Treponema sp.]|jgi:D-tyrosyl-tRNA(Tyr) deacylase|nr:D-tyrosyl-tRNA(Tyr) deacylase [Treponema sp.]
MKAVVQRVTDASVTVDGVVKGQIDSGLLVYLGVAHNDSESDADWLSEKIAYIRIFNDKDGKMNLSLKDLTSDVSNQNENTPAVLAISQFTLLGDSRKGRRPSWNRAAAPEKAKQLYLYFMESIRKHNLSCESGEFQAHMKVSYTNDGPVTIILDTEEI